MAKDLVEFLNDGIESARLNLGHSSRVYPRGRAPREMRYGAEGLNRYLYSAIGLLPKDYPEIDCVEIQARASASTPDGTAEGETFRGILTRYLDKRGLQTTKDHTGEPIYNFMFRAALPYNSNTPGVHIGQTPSKSSVLVTQLRTTEDVIGIEIAYSSPFRCMCMLLPEEVESISLASSGEEGLSPRFESQENKLIEPNSPLSNHLGYRGLVTSIPSFEGLGDSKEANRMRAALRELSRSVSHPPLNSGALSSDGTFADEFVAVHSSDGVYVMKLNSIEFPLGLTLEESLIYSVLLETRGKDFPEAAKHILEKSPVYRGTEAIRILETEGRSLK